MCANICLDETELLTRGLTHEEMGQGIKLEGARMITCSGVLWWRKESLSFPGECSLQLKAPRAIFHFPTGPWPGQWILRGMSDAKDWQTPSEQDQRANIFSSAGCWFFIAVVQLCGCCMKAATDDTRELTQPHFNKVSLALAGGGLDLAHGPQFAMPWVCIEL